ncbi:excinuclease ABC subunit UvrA, partial [bacterium]|nr:excinuclease ABC subunit UvrA [bacterium]
TPQAMVDAIMEREEGTPAQVLAPVVRDRKGEFKRELNNYMKEGFIRARIDGKVYDLAEAPTLDKKYKHDIDIFVDRVKVRPGVERRLTDSVETALRLGDGLLRVIFGEDEERLFSEHFACVDCGISYPEIEPRMFSFNNPHGACPTCDGLGSKMFIDPDMIVPNPNLSLRDGAVVPWESRVGSVHFHQVLESLGKHYKFSIHTPWKKLPKKITDVLLNGSGDEEIQFVYEDSTRRYKYARPFEGIIPNLERRYHETGSESAREDIRRFMSVMPCADCGGSRLRVEARHVKVAERNIAEVSALSLTEAGAFFDELSLSDKEMEIAGRILREIKERLGFLLAVGLEYLSLERTSGTLSGGESQRIRLATQIGSSLVGVLYILDEPSIGLHQRDNERLLNMLKRLRDLGNTVIVVEHDADTIEAADWVIDLGPGAGVHGGQVVFEGPPQKMIGDPDSRTGGYISGRLEIPVPPKRRPLGHDALKLTGCTGNNLKDVDVDFPLGVLTCVTGVSGSGKSTLVIDTLTKSLSQHIYRSKERPAPHKKLTGLSRIDKVINIDQSPIGRTPRSNPATYTGVMDDIRKAFAQANGVSASLF